MTTGSDAQFFLCLISYCSQRMDARQVQQVVNDLSMPSEFAVELLLRLSGVQATHSLYPELLKRYDAALSWFRSELIAQGERLCAPTNYASTDVSQESNGLVGIAPAVLAPSSGTRLKAGQAFG